MGVSQKDFEKTVQKFVEMEDARDKLWERARNLLKEGYELEAYILILATWNFAGFRYFLKDFDLDKFQNLIDKINPLFEKIKNLTFNKVDFNDKELRDDIKAIYSKLKEMTKQTGATKIMALKNPALFPMWDTAIRKKFKISNKGSSEDFINFLNKIKKKFKGIIWRKKKHFAKAIDEYNYVKVEGIRRQERKKKRNK